MHGICTNIAYKAK